MRRKSHHIPLTLRVAIAALLLLAAATAFPTLSGANARPVVQSEGETF
ncbi:hypothetical protein [Paradevosia shaoguanensis]|jgi:hypothetical protein|uniref:Uncharacterized protein n=1 Tax=Paradevosia shaoguanensis TaxID=1335043 RepID=A0AA41QIK9_9HYPH|nr:hypothetical protein [Paradevosia shaoguanensis]MBI4046730.1 hypothetical protein [Devosia nanyangense]QMV03770.1 hypothetical protein GHV40_20765 [Devosia sp. D6-9]CDP53329.1 hypothetical protein [Devosia sp. DBB001]MCF1740786.1 hypothetical protein [Paradevosia shaoguanensis]MCI0125270.1 hypothetical protein [Paradevosia shaoguanensis]